MSAPSSPSLPLPFTKHQLKAAHKAELKALSSLPIYKGKGGNKLLKADEAKMAERHRRELEEFDRKGNNEEGKEKGEDEDGNAKVNPPNRKGPSYSHLRRQRRAEAESLLHSESAAAAANMVDLKEDENRLFECRMSPKGWFIVDVKADGNCLFRSVGDQIRRKRIDIDGDLLRRRREWMEGKGRVEDGDGEDSHWMLRDIAALHIDEHRGDFAHFLLADSPSPSSPPIGPSDFDEYISALIDRSNPQWGSHAEIVAMARELKRDIIVHHARGDEIHVGWDQKGGQIDSDPIRISFHQYYFGLGEHFNSVAKSEEEGSGKEKDGKDVQKDVE